MMRGEGRLLMHDTKTAEEGNDLSALFLVHLYVCMYVTWSSDSHVIIHYNTSS